jgi:hypothetical protein
MKSEIDKVYAELMDCRTKKIVHALKEINGKLSEEIN